MKLDHVYTRRAENEKRLSPDLCKSPTSTQNRSILNGSPSLSYKINFNRPDPIEKLRTVDLTS